MLRYKSLFLDNNNIIPEYKCTNYNIIGYHWNLDYQKCKLKMALEFKAIKEMSNSLKLAKVFFYINKMMNFITKILILKSKLFYNLDWIFLLL